MADAPGIDPEMLEQLRRGVPLRLSALGRFRFDGEDVSHPRVEAALRAGLDTNDAGEAIVHLGDQWCYLTVDDCPLRGVQVEAEADTLQLHLDDGRRVALDREALWEEPNAGLRTQAPSQRNARPLAVRLTNAAAMQLSEWITLDAEDRASLTHGGRSTLIPDTQPAA